jgi:hypothetical protein
MWDSTNGKMCRRREKNDEPWTGGGEWMEHSAILGVLEKKDFGILREEEWKVLASQLGPISLPFGKGMPSAGWGG